MKMILQKYLAASGFCSRRQAEGLIKKAIAEENKNILMVNGSLPKIGMLVDEEDEIFVKAKKIKNQTEKIYLLLNKPLGYTCTSRQFKNEKNVFELLKDYSSSNLHIVGRLDKNSRGLLILTNDGEFTQKMTHPKFAHEKEYVIEAVPENLNSANIEQIIFQFKKGLEIGEGDGLAWVKAIEFLKKEKQVHYFKIILTQGKKRQIRRMFTVLGWEVKDIFRIRIDKYKINKIKSGNYQIF